MAKIVRFIIPFRKLAALFLLCIFTLSITPVILLHDVAANHHDVCYHNFDEAGKQFSKADINCTTIFFVAEAQFLPYCKDISIAPAESVLAGWHICTIVSFYSQHHFYSELRGPPAIA